jgi:hypothetical protein
MSSILGQSVPTGGAITLSISASGSGMVLSRAVSGVGGLGPFTTLYSGSPVAAYIDAGDYLPAPLSSGSLYVYQLQDANGTTQSAAYQPSPQLNVEIEPWLYLMIRLFQAGISNLTPPNGVNSNVQVLQQMPIVGIPPMPFVTINQDLIQQQEVPVGQSISQPDYTGTWAVTEQAKRVFRITVMATNTADRDYYRDACIGIFISLIASVFNNLGDNVTHRWQASSYQMADDPNGMSPGFYGADILCEVKGTFNIAITQNYGIMETITFVGTTPDGVHAINTSVTASG